MADQPPYLSYYQSLIRLDRRAAEAVVEGYLARPRDLAALYTEVFAPALIHAGREWQRNRISVVHEHYLSAVTIDLIHRYGPTIWTTPPADAPVAVACCAPGERHSISSAPRGSSSTIWAPIPRPRRSVASWPRPGPTCSACRSPWTAACRPPPP